MEKKYQININAVVGYLFSSYRSNKKLDQYEAAKLVAMSKSSMSKLESGNINFNIEHIFILCEAYDIDLSVMFSDLILMIDKLEKNNVLVIKKRKDVSNLLVLTRQQIAFFAKKS